MSEILDIEVAVYTTGRTADWTGTFRQFLLDNEDGIQPPEAAEIAYALLTPRAAYQGGGGAEGRWLLRAVKGGEETRRRDAE